VKPITSEMWATGNLALPDLEGRQSHAGFDWGFKDDLTAMAYAFVLDPIEIGGAEKRRVAVLCDVWIPADGPRNLAEEPWASWITDGFLRVTPGAITDTENIYATIAERQKEFGIATVAFDGNNAREFGSRIITDYGITAFPHGQGFSKMNEPTRELLDMLHEGPADPRRQPGPGLGRSQPRAANQPERLRPPRKRPRQGQDRPDRRRDHGHQRGDVRRARARSELLRDPRRRSRLMHTNTFIADQQSGSVELPPFRRRLATSWPTRWKTRSIRSRIPRSSAKAWWP
jgi:hypothetical protein